MKGDFTRLTFDPQKHYTGVLKQQGRVDLDADWNEQIAIDQYRIETQTVDSLGGCAAPLHAAAFGVFTDTATLESAESTRLTNLGILPLAAGDFLLTPGRFYAGGTLVENETITSFSKQPCLPDASPIASNGIYLAYLDVWEQHLTFLESPGIREVALGGPDTTTRKRTVWQVKLMPVASGTHCLSDLTDWNKLVAGSTGKLAARALPEADSTDPCIVPASAGYRGLENQLYRVEIHKSGTLTPGANQATFKWSRDNGSVVFAIEEFLDGQPTTRLRMQSLGRDQVLALRKGDWVEVLDGDNELTFTPGTMAQIDDIDQDDLVITLSTTVSGMDINRSPKVRRWDSAGALPARIPAGNQGFIPLENGVEVKFSPGNYAVGDYWLIPARTILGTPALEGTGGIEWPQDSGGSPLPESPEGIQHHYCRLAVLTLDDAGLTATDCRLLFPPATELRSLFYLGGDGQEAMPGQSLPQPLRIGVSRGQWPVPGAAVRFKISAGSGSLTWGTQSGQEITATTDSNGVIEVAWILDSATQSQVVEAVLEDAAADPVHLGVHFNANLSIASQVAFSTKCSGLSKAKTVQQALDLLCANAFLRYAGGDGQSGRPKQVLIFPLEVRLANGSWPVSGQKVTFRIESGGGSLVGASGTELTVTTDAEGYASCQWQLGGATAPQQVVAFWDKQPKHFIHFNAFVDRQGQNNAEDSIRIQDVMIGGKPLELRGFYPIDEMREGIRIFLDRTIEQDFLQDHMSFQLSVEVPYPLDRHDRTLYGQDLIGYRPLALIGKTHLEGANEIIVYMPVDPVLNYLSVLIERIAEAGFGESVIARLILKGNFVYGGRDPQVYVDADAFAAVPQTTPTGLHLPSGNEVRGGFFETWFNLLRG